MKLADRIANVEASLENKNADKLAKYRSEQAGFREGVSVDPKGAKMLAYLDALLNLEAPPYLRQRFECAACGERASTITLWESFPTRPIPGNMTFDGWPRQGYNHATTKKPDDVKAALAARDCMKLRFLIGDQIDFFCKDCRLPYCMEHWKPHIEHWDGGFYDWTEGTCPKGHRHEIGD